MTHTEPASERRRRDEEQREAHCRDTDRREVHEREAQGREAFTREAYTREASDARRTASMDHVLGTVIGEELRNPAVTDIHVNDDGIIRVIDHGSGVRVVGEMAPDRAESLIRLLATHMGASATRRRPTVSGVLPGTMVRFQGVLPPVSPRPIFALRKAAEVVHTLDDFVRDGVLSQQAATIIRASITARENIVISGGTGSGKTTLINACLAEPAITRDRIVIIEDTRELQCSAADCVRLIAPPALRSVTMDDLVKTTLRLFPDRIVIGEVRGGEALSMIKAWGTGHPGGLCSVHANGPRDALYRLEDLMREATVTIPRRSIASAIGLVVFIERGSFNAAHRRVAAITRPRMDAAGEYLFEDIEV